MNNINILKFYYNYTTKKMRVHTDGSCLGNPGPGGWACVFEDGHRALGGEMNTTNNRMELTAVIRALEKNSHITIVTDSKYVKDGVEKWMTNWKTRGWKTASGSPVKNQDLWKCLDNLLAVDTQWEWVRGHTGDQGNEAADTLARSCAMMLKEA